MAIITFKANNGQILEAEDISLGDSGPSYEISDLPPQYYGWIVKSFDQKPGGSYISNDDYDDKGDTIVLEAPIGSTQSVAFHKQ